VKKSNLLIALLSLAVTSAYATEVKYVGVKNPNEDPAKRGSCMAKVVIDESGNVVSIEGQIQDPKKDFPGLYQTFNRGNAYSWKVDRDKKSQRLKGVRAKSPPTDHLFGGLSAELELKDLDKGSIQLKIKQPISYGGFVVRHRKLDCKGMVVEPVIPSHSIPVTEPAFAPAVSSGGIAN
jgi:hypothetical protein